jgi:hypothetical protein
MLVVVCGASCGVGNETPTDEAEPVGTIQAAITDMNYALDTNPDLPNPERGVSYWVGSSGSDPITVANHFLYLGPSCGTDLVWLGRTHMNTSQVLKDWANAAIAQRDMGRKVIFRPRYDTSSAEGLPNGCGPMGMVEGDSYARMQNHAQAIAAMLGDLEIKPIVAFIEMGYLGSWGEWNTAGTSCGMNLSTCRMHAPVLLAASQVNDRIHFAQYVINTYQNAGMRRPVGLRRPEFYRDSEFYNGGVANTKMGFYNDCFMFSNSDGGTFSHLESGYTGYSKIYSDPAAVFPTSDLAKSYMQGTAPNGSQGGETCSPKTDLTDLWTMDPSSVVPRLDLDSYQYLHPGTRAAPPTDFRQRMAETTTGGIPNWNIIKSRLGYRYQVTKVDYPMSAAPGASITVSVWINNSGFAKIPYERTAYTVLQGPSAAYVVGGSNPKPETYTLINPSTVLNSGLRSWNKGTTTEFRQTFPAPTTAGTYSIHLYLPDADCVGNPNCIDATKVKYAVRLATTRGGANIFNATLGSATTGTNNLGVSFTVTDSSTAVGSVTPGDFLVSYDQSNAYFTYLAPEFCTGGLEVQQMSLVNGAKTTLVTGGCSSPAQSASDGTNLFYARLQSPKAIQAKALSGGTSPAPVTIASAPNTLAGTGIKVDGSRVYWADGNKVQSTPKGGGAVTTHFTGSLLEYVLGVDATDIYFEHYVSSPCCSYELRKIPIAGGSSTVLHSQSSRHFPFAMQSGNLYFASLASGNSTIWRLASSGGAPTMLYSATSTCILSMAASDATMYWSENNTCDLVPGNASLRERSNPAGDGMVSTELDGLTGPYALNIVGSDLFWIDGPQGAKTLRRITTTNAFNSCEGHCGGPATGCWCDASCTGFGDCCPDFADACTPPNSCDGRCGTQAPAGCWCDTACSGFGDCCPNFGAACP